MEAPPPRQAVPLGQLAVEGHGGDAFPVQGVAELGGAALRGDERDDSAGGPPCGGGGGMSRWRSPPPSVMCIMEAVGRGKPRGERHRGKVEGVGDRAPVPS